MQSKATQPWVFSDELNGCNALWLILVVSLSTKVLTAVMVLYDYNEKAAENMVKKWRERKVVHK